MIVLPRKSVVKDFLGEEDPAGSRTHFTSKRELIAAGRGTASADSMEMQGGPGVQTGRSPVSYETKDRDQARSPGPEAGGRVAHP